MEPQQFALAAYTTPGLPLPKAVMFIPRTVDLTIRSSTQSGLAKLPIEILLLILDSLGSSDTWATALLQTASDRFVLEKYIRQCFFDRMNLALASRFTLDAATGFSVQEVGLGLDPSLRSDASAQVDPFPPFRKPRLSEACHLCWRYWLIGGDHSLARKWLVCYDKSRTASEIYCPYSATWQDEEHTLYPHKVPYDIYTKVRSSKDAWIYGQEGVED